jgi:hypothetical protein
MRKLGEIGWRWKENGQPSPLVKALASRLSTSGYSPAKLLVGSWFATDFDGELIQTCLDALSASQCRVFVGSKEPLPGQFWPLIEKYYSTEHSIGPLDVEYLEVSERATCPISVTNLGLFSHDQGRQRTSRCPTPTSSSPLIWSW